MRLRRVEMRPELDAPTNQPHDLVKKQSAPTSDRMSESNGESRRAILEASSNKGGKPTNTSDQLTLILQLLQNQAKVSEKQGKMIEDLD